jgi:hypothetical protein
MHTLFMLWLYAASADGSFGEHTENRMKANWQTLGCAVLQLATSQGEVAMITATSNFLTATDTECH